MIDIDEQEEAPEVIDVDKEQLAREVLEVESVCSRAASQVKVENQVR